MTMVTQFRASTMMQPTILMAKLPTELLSQCPTEGRNPLSS